VFYAHGVAAVLEEIRNDLERMFLGEPGNRARSELILVASLYPALLTAATVHLGEHERPDGRLRTFIDEALKRAVKSVPDGIALSGMRASAIRAHLLFDLDAARDFQGLAQQVGGKPFLSLGGLQFRDVFARSTERWGEDPQRAYTYSTAKEYRDGYRDDLFKAISHLIAQSQAPNPVEENARTALCRAYAARLNVSSSAHPAHLVPTLLAEPMRVSKIRRSRAQVLSGPRTLYARARIKGKRPAIDALSEERSVVLLGDPGAGKSTVLTALVVRHLDQGRPGALIRLPDLERILASDGARRRRAIERLWDFVIAELYPDTLAGIDNASRRAEVIRLQEDPDVLVALDGLDEVRDADHRSTIRSFVQDLANGPGYVVLSSRFTGYEGFDFPITEIALGSMTAKGAKRTVKSWYRDGTNPRGEQRAMRALKALRDRREEPAPILVSLIAAIAEDREVPTGRSALYEAYLAHFLERRSKLFGRGLARTVELRRAAIDIAWGMAGYRGEGPSEWLDIATGEELVEFAPKRSDAVEELQQVDGLLTLYGPREIDRASLQQQYRWAHRTLHEHLAGVRIADEVRINFETGFAMIERMAQEVGRWEVSLHQAFDILSPRLRAKAMDAFFKLLREGDPAELVRPFVRDLLAAAEFKPATLEAFVELCLEDDNWDDAWLVNPTMTEARFRDAFIAGLPSLQTTALGLFAEYSSPARGPSVQEVVEAFSAPSGWIGGSWLWRLSEIEPDEAAICYLDYLKSGSDEWVAAPRFERVSSAVRERFVAELRTVPYPRNRDMVSAAQLMGWRLGPNEPPDVLCAWADLGSPVVEPGTTHWVSLQAYATQDYPEAVALSAGRHVWESVPYEDLAPAARLGALVESAGLGVPMWTFSDADAMLAFENVAEGLETASPGEVARLMEIVVRYPSAPPPELLRYIIRILARCPDENFPSLLPTPRWGLIAGPLQRIASRAAAGQLRTAILQELEQSHASAFSWATELLGFVERTDHEMLKMLKWGADRNICLIHLAGMQFDWSAEYAQKLLDVCGAKGVVWHVECYWMLAEKLASLGMLADQRAVLLKMKSQVEVVEGPRYTRRRIVGVGRY